MATESPRNIDALAALVAALDDEDRRRFERIYQLSVSDGRLSPPETMVPWLRTQFGSVDAVQRQRIVRVTNRVTLEGALFNTLRAQQPIDAPLADTEIETLIENSIGGPFCHPLAGTPADSFGRIRGRWAVTASNVAKYEGWHGVIVFDEHHPLRFTLDQVCDYVDLGQRWARAAHESDPEACYPLFLWNCLWRSGASIVHGHAQVVVTRGVHFARVEAWRQAAVRYRDIHGDSYFSDLVAVHRALGMAVERGRATILPSLTPFKEKETHILAPTLDDDLKAALFLALQTFIKRLGVQSFNLVLYQAPLCDVQEDWRGFPYIVRLIDRGEPQSNRSDIGSMEMFAQSVVTSDPFRVSEAIRAQMEEYGA